MPDGTDSLNKTVGTLIKTTLVDFPGRVSCSVFLTGCNLRCPYCYNKDLVFNTLQKNDSVTLQEIFNHIEKRKGILQGLVISGGEALLNPYTPVLIKKAKSLGYKIKLDTNGSLPEKLSELINSKDLSPDYVAMDIKCSKEKISLLHGNNFLWENICKSIKILSTLPKEKREWRTVLVPPIIAKEDIKTIAQLLPKDASWFFSSFAPGSCLEKSYNSVLPYTNAQEEEIISFAKTFIKGASKR